MKFLVSCATVLAAWAMVASVSFAGIVLAAGTFSGRIDRWDTGQNSISTFSDIKNSWAGGDAVALAGLAYNPVTNAVIATDRARNRVYEIDTSGTVIGEHSTGSLPSGVAVDRFGNVYIANTGDGSITKFNADFTQSTTYLTPEISPFAPTFPTGLAITSSGSLLVSTALGIYGTWEYTPSQNDFAQGTFLPFNQDTPTANGLIAIKDDGSVYIGSVNIDLPTTPGTAVSIFTSEGVADGSINFDSLLPPPSDYTGTQSPNPSGVAFDGDNLIVGALGRFNDRDNGGLFLFNPDGSLKVGRTQTTPYGAVLNFSAVPEPSSLFTLSSVLGAAGLVWRRRNVRQGSKPNV
ncbi:MAG: PEP-CTERM sorting domain-containing protein [Pirellula sp.]|jgi:hypothetical protein|nr:PEP-CTERM sorting domain-containing protein [Pirellula sp.]